MMSLSLGCSVSAIADSLSAVAPAHGPVLMLYVSRPIGARGATPVFGLRLDRSSALAGSMTAPTIASSSPRRPLIDVQLSDLQFQHAANVRVEFGKRLAWDMRSHEFSLPNSRQSRTINFVASNAP
jgi:hypothetical protein